MVSQTAIDALDELVAQGLKPTPRDVVRLNAIGLKLEAAGAKHTIDSTYQLPRVAAVSESLYFRQPTIGHEIWLDKVRSISELGDYQTSLALHCFALSRPHSELPDPANPDAVKAAVDAFLPKCADFTRDQLFAAVQYARLGADPSADEHSVAPKGEDDEEPGPDFAECVALGVLNEGRAVLWGISEADMLNMRTSELAAVIDRAYNFHNMQRNSEESFWQGRFYATLDEIKGRLTKEKDNGIAKAAV